MNEATQFYRKILKQYNKEYAHKKDLKDCNNSPYSIANTKDNVSFFLYLDKTLTIKNASFSCSKTDYLSSLMEITCRVIKGLPLKEVRDHGVIRIENFLNPALKKTVRGVALPTNYSLDFLWLNELLIDISDKILKESKIKNKINFYYPRPTNDWKEKTDEQKILILNDYIKDIKSSTNIKSNGVQITKVANDNFFIEFLDNSSPIDKSIYCMELEKIIRNDYDFLVVYMKRAQDFSSLRRKLDLK